MKGAARIAITSWFSLAVSMAQPGASEVTPSPGPTNHPVKIVTKDKNGKCSVDSWGPKTSLRVSVSRKDTVTWQFQNDCSKDMTLEVANFQPHGPSVKPGEPAEKDPLDDKCARKAAVSHRKTGEFKCGFKLTFKGPNAIYHYPEDARTYKYDILGDGQPLLDPEIEVRP
ncbi:MAG: hypothetical protein DMF81_13660 [Acidobacteria bacterium]|nr:MAG: hypothetical protein DMF81_13660 [Acidobacteriota bacterium]